MTPDAVISAQVARERTWVLAGRDARYTYAELRMMSALPEESGGLGYELSESALRGLAQQGHETRGELIETRAESRQRQAAEIDGRARGAREDYDRARRALNAPPPSADDIALDPVAGMAALKLWQAEQEAATKLIADADRRLDAAHRREAALLGLDAPTKLEADVTTHDGTVDDLNAALARLGKTPLDVTG